jgi:hypothetical protein
MNEIMFKKLRALYAISSMLEHSNIQQIKYVVIETSDKLHASADLPRQMSSHYQLERNLVTTGKFLTSKY